jgi:copper chaperone
MSQAIETAYRVQGMTCGHCEQSVVQSVEALVGVEAAAARHADGELRVRGAASESEIREAVEGAGYTLQAGDAGETPAAAVGRHSCGCGC